MPGIVVRLTWSPGHDRGPVWLPGDSGVLYAFERYERPDRDGCLGALPRSGGQQRWRVCVAPERPDSTESLLWPAVSAGGQLAVLFERRDYGGFSYGADYRALVVTRADDWMARRATVELPGATDDGVLHASASHFRWLDEDHLLYRADLSFIVRPPFMPDPRDTVTSGRAIVAATLGAGGTTRVTVPGTDFASSFDVAGTDTLFYTLGGDSRVYRRILSTGVVDVIWDFAPDIARGVQVRGRRLAAVVGGVVRFAVEPSIPEPVQRDSGGVVHLVHLDSGTVRVLDIGLPVRHPAFAAAGDRIVVEAALLRTTDLYLIVLDP